VSQVIKLLSSVLLVLGALAAEASTYKVGVLMPLSGKSADRGVAMKNAIDLFVQGYNQSSKENGGIKLELVVKDDEDDVEKAKIVATELVKDESIIAVIGGYYPEATKAAARIISDAKIPFVTPFASAQDIQEVNNYAFALNVTDGQLGAYLAVYIKGVLKKDNVLVIHNTDQMGTNLKQSFMDKAERLGLTVVKTLAAERESRDKDWANKNLPDSVENEKIGVIAALTHSDTGLELLPQIREKNISAPVLATPNWTNPKFLEMDDKFTDGVYVASPFLWEIANEKASLFRLAYQKKFKADPTVANALAYDSILLLSAAIEKLSEPQSKTLPTREGIRNFMVNLDYQDAAEGITGLLYFKNKNDHTAEYVAKWQADLRKEGATDTEKEDDKSNSKTSPFAIVGSLPRKPEASVDTGRTAALAEPIQRADNRSINRDLYVSQLTNGRFKVAPLQLTKPREEYVMRQLAERVKKGYLVVIDGQPFHVIDTVFVGVDIVRINDINIKDMQWDVDTFMWFKWTNPRLDVKDIEKITAINAIKEQSLLFKEDMSGAIKYRAYRKRLTLGTPFDLSTFPFDSQTLKMSIAHINKNSTHMMLVLDTRHMENAPIKDIKPQEWKYQGRVFYSDLYRYESTFGDPDYRLLKGYKSPIYFSTLDLNIDVKRILQPYIFTFFLPLIIILGIILLILWVPLDQFSPRISAAISGLVGVLVYHMSQKNAFPKVGYTMFADYYFLFAYVFVVAMMAQIIVIQMMMSAGKKEEAKAFNQKLAIGALGTSTAIYTLMTVWAIYF
jgi:ABC-type branched-subunit amino acid transport system substrate-binding protein